MRILVSGAGIAGPALCHWLIKYGHTPTLIEAAPRLRTGGYVIDFWGLGFDIAEKMGLLPKLKTIGYLVKDVKLVNSTGERVGGFSASLFEHMTHGRYLSLPRGELAAAIFRSIEGQVETLFGDRISAITDEKDAVAVRFERGAPRTFDLVIGADGLHSGVRRLVFGELSRFEKFMGYYVAAFEVPGYRPRDELTYVMYNRPGVQVARFAMHDDRTLILFVFAATDDERIEDERRALHTRFADAGWECPQILAALDQSDSVYFDRVSQIRMESWTRGRVALIGDAAACPSLLAGQGSALAMLAAYVLAGELAQARGDFRAAFAAYESRLRPFITAKRARSGRSAAACATRCSCRATRPRAESATRRAERGSVRPRAWPARRPRSRHRRCLRRRPPHRLSRRSAARAASA